MEWFIILGFLLTLILGFTLYGWRSGGVEAMLERERFDNTIDADERLEIKEMIDFFGQVKRVDSLYFHKATQRLQIKTNNRLSEPLVLADIKELNFLIGDTVAFTQAVHPINDTWKALAEWSQALDPDSENPLAQDEEIALVLKTHDAEHVIRFASNTQAIKVIAGLGHWAEETL